MKFHKTTKVLFTIALIVLALFAAGGLYYLWQVSGGGSSSVGRQVSGNVGVGAPIFPGVAEDAASKESADFFYPAPIPSPTGAPPDDRERIGERIIRSGSISMRVDDTEKRLEEVRLAVEAAGGFVADSSIADRAGVRTANLTARIPVDRFEDVRTDIRSLASTVFNETTNAEDVTAQFVDLDARLTAARAEERQYLAILSRADTIEETLMVTSQLAQVRARIEQMEGTLRYLRDRTEYATLSITLTEEARVEIPTEEWRPGEVLRQSLRDLVIVLQSLVNFVIAALIFLAGLILPLALIVWLIIRIIKRAMRATKGKKK